MKTFLQLNGLVAGCMIAGFSSMSAALAEAPPSVTEETGVWQKHEYSFAFMGFTSIYSCDGLADKLKILLIASGARSDVTARAGACAQGFGTPDRFARADLTFYALATPNDASSNPGATIPAAWRAVGLATNRPRELQTGDCELVQQFQSQVLPLLSIRALDSHTTCVPNQISGSLIDLKFESLSALDTSRGKR